MHLVPILKNAHEPAREANWLHGLCFPFLVKSEQSDPPNTTAPPLSATTATSLARLGPHVPSGPHALEKIPDRVCAQAAGGQRGETWARLFTGAI